MPLPALTVGSPMHKASRSSGDIGTKTNRLPSTASSQYYRMQVPAGRDRNEIQEGAKLSIAGDSPDWKQEGRIMEYCRQQVLTLNNRVGELSNKEDTSELETKEGGKTE